MTATAVPAATRPALSVPNKIGLGLCFLLGLADLLSLGAIGGPQGDTPGPPVGILLVAAVLGVVTLVTVVWTWRSRNRTGARITAATRILSALTAVPAFFVEDVSAGLVAVAAGSVVITIVAVALVLAPGRE